MGRGSSGASKNGGGGGAKRPVAGGGTPSGVTVQQFQAMSEAQQISTIDQILADKSIVVPAYLDASDTSKLMYALGMNQKPEVVSDAALDQMQGRELFRTVYEYKGSMPPPSSQDITDQIRNGDYTQLSGSGGSAYGRALYFATGFYSSAVYGNGPSKVNPIIMRAKIKSNAKLAKDSALDTALNNSRFLKYGYEDGKAFLAISKGYDGWYSGGGYNMIINRGILAASSQNKSIFLPKARRNSRERISTSWSTARIAP